MLKKPVYHALNEQVKHEFYSAYLYLSMAAYFDVENLPGFSSWMRKQFSEEQEHAMRLYEYIHDRGGHVELGAIDKPQSEFASALEVFEISLEHEKKVTALIHDIYAVAVKENDLATQVFLQWFITEQVEEEKTFTQVKELLEKAGSDLNGLYRIDALLADRAD